MRVERIGKEAEIKFLLSVNKFTVRKMKLVW